jgi:hypothetical protein
MVACYVEREMVPRGVPEVENSQETEPRVIAKVIDLQEATERSLSIIKLSKVVYGNIFMLVETSASMNKAKAQ